MKVTLRGTRMYEFVDRVVSLAIPRVKDFRGLDPNGFDKAGNFNFGFTEQTVFPEVDAAAVTFQQGMNITMVTTAHSPEHGRELLKPFVSYLIRRYAHHISIHIDNVPRHKALLIVTIVSIHGQKDTFKAKLGRGLTKVREAGFADALTLTGDFAHPPRKPVGLTESGSEPANPLLAPTDVWVSYLGCDTEEQAAKVVETWNAWLSEDRLVDVTDVQHLHLRKYL